MKLFKRKHLESPYCVHFSKEELETILGDIRDSAELLVDVRLKMRIKWGESVGVPSVSDQAGS